MRRLTYVLTVAALTATLVAVPAVFLGGETKKQPATPGPRSSRPVAAEIATATDVEQTVSALQTHLRAQPRDVRGWASLVIGYVGQARITGDPTFYPKAQQALDRAQRLNGSDDLVLAAAGVLAAARHDFAAALRWADRSLAANPYGAQAHLARVDALVELGRYKEAAAAARRADAVRPGLPSFARLAYLAELRGDLRTASRLMGRALGSARRPSDVAVARLRLGDLARRSGDLNAAAAHYDAALAAVPGFVPALVGRARVALARDDVAAAVPALQQAARQMPLPEHVRLLGETYESLGRRGEAQEQYAVARTALALAGTQGVGTDLEAALFQADHGDRVAALVTARREWARRQSVQAADALAWALHVNGRSREALRYADAALRLGTRDGGFLLHRGMILRSLGQRSAARRDLAAALAVAGDLSPVQRFQAWAALNALGGQP